MKRVLISLAASLGLAAASAKGILCLTFDDFGWDGWAESIGLFERYEAHATFFALGQLDTNAVGKLQRLAAAGHTIGIHTMHHVDVPKELYSGLGSVCFNRYEILPQLKALKPLGLKRFFLAYPNNRHSDESDAELSLQFERMRAGVPRAQLFKSGVSYYAPSNTASLAEFDEAFFPVSDLPKHRVMEGVGVGEYYHTRIDDILKAIRRVAERDEVLVIFSHDIVPNAKGVSMKREWLELMLKTARECGVAIKSFAELGPVAPVKMSEPLLVSLTFDDGLADHLSIVAPELERRGWRGEFNVVTSLIGKDDRQLTWDGVRELHRRGHEIGNHTLTHPDLSKLAAAGKLDRVRAEVVGASDILERETGVRPKLLCYPGTDASAAATKVIREAGLEPMYVKRYCFGAWKIKVGEFIARLRSHGIRRADFLVHGVRKGGGGWEPFATKADFIAYLDELKAAEARGEIKIVPYAELLQR